MSPCHERLASPCTHNVTPLTLHRVQHSAFTPNPAPAPSKHSQCTVCITTVYTLSVQPGPGTRLCTQPVPPPLSGRKVLGQTLWILASLAILLLQGTEHLASSGRLLQQAPTQGGITPHHSAELRPSALLTLTPGFHRLLGIVESASRSLCDWPWQDTPIPLKAATGLWWHREHSGSLQGTLTLLAHTVTLTHHCL